MYAIIKHGGKQYKVSEGDYLNLDKMGLEKGSEITLDVLAINDNEKLSLEGGTVKASVVMEGRDKKVIIYKKRRRKDSKLKRGFRRDYTRVKITTISA
jgi:large subunit ribosomal protein L21